MNIFTNEDYRRIQSWLKKNAIKDSEFIEVLNANQDDTLVIVQDGTNRKISVKNFLSGIDESIASLDTKVTEIDNNTYKKDEIDQKRKEIDNIFISKDSFEEEIKSLEDAVKDYTDSAVKAEKEERVNADKELTSKTENLSDKVNDIYKLWQAGNSSYISNIPNGVKDDKSLSFFKTTLRKLGFTGNCTISKIQAFQASSANPGHIGLRYCRVMRVTSRTVQDLYVSDSAVYVTSGNVNKALDAWNMISYTDTPIALDEDIYIGFSLSQAISTCTTTRLYSRTDAGESFTITDPAYATTGSAYSPILRIECMQSNSTYAKDEVDSLIQAEADTRQEQIASLSQDITGINVLLNGKQAQIDDLNDAVDGLSEKIDDIPQTYATKTYVDSSVGKEAETRKDAIIEVSQSITALRMLVNGKQDELESGENIKTINGESILGSGDIKVTSDVDKAYVDNAVSTESTSRKKEISSIKSNIKTLSDRTDDVYSMYAGDNSTHIASIDSSSKSSANLSLCKTSLRSLGFTKKCIIKKISVYQTSLGSMSDDVIGLRYCHVMKIHNGIVTLLYSSQNAITIGSYSVETKSDSWEMLPYNYEFLSPDDVIYIGFTANSVLNKNAVNTRLVVKTKTDLGYTTNNPATITTTSFNFRPIFYIECLQQDDVYSKNETDTIIGQESSIRQDQINEINNRIDELSKKIGEAGSSGGVDKSYVDAQISELRAYVDDLALFTQDNDDNPLT